MVRQIAARILSIRIIILTAGRVIYLVFAMVDLAKRCEAQEKEIAALIAENKALRGIIEASTRKTEAKLEDARQQQIELAEISAPTEEAAESQPDEKAPSLKGRRRRKARIPLAEKLEGLPVEKITHVIPEEVKRSPDLYREIGSEKSLEVIYRAARISLRRIVRKKFVKKGCGERAPIVAKSPPRFSSSFVSARARGQIA